MRTYTIFAYTQFGVLFADTIVASNVTQLFAIFRAEYPDAEIADYFYDEDC
jgi:hypothetical protein